MAEQESPIPPKKIQLREEKLTVEAFCDANGVSQLHRISLIRKYKAVLMTQTEWEKETKDSITINKRS